MIEFRRIRLSKPGGVEREREQSRVRKLHLKQRVMDGYGGQCSCCGEESLIFLTIDHVNGGGVKEHRAMGGGSSSKIYRQVIAEGWPDKYRVLCFNCNFAEHWGGCPHSVR